MNASRSPEEGDTYNFSVASENAGERLDRVVTDFLEGLYRRGKGQKLSRSQVEKIIKSGNLSVDGRTELRSGVSLRTGMQINMIIPGNAAGKLEPDSSVQYEVLHIDDDIIVVNKPAGLVVHPGAGNKTGTLIQGLLSRYGLGALAPSSETRPGVVHRLDKDTSGVLVLARTMDAYQALIRQFQPPRQVSRTYLAVVSELPRGGQEARSKAKGRIELPIARHRNRRTRMAVRTSGRPAATLWALEESLAFGKLLRLKLETGRTHQIRVHLEAVGAPILGDPTYGAKLTRVPERYRKEVLALGRQALHAAELSFVHPVTHDEFHFKVDLPADMLALLEALRAK